MDSLTLARNEKLNHEFNRNDISGSPYTKNYKNVISETWWSWQLTALCGRRGKPATAVKKTKSVTPLGPPSIMRQNWDLLSNYYEALDSAFSLIFLSHENRAKGESFSTPSLPRDIKRLWLPTKKNFIRPPGRNGWSVCLAKRFYDVS